MNFTLMDDNQNQYRKILTVGTALAISIIFYLIIARSLQTHKSSLPR